MFYSARVAGWDHYLQIFHLAISLFFVMLASQISKAYNRYKFRSWKREMQATNSGILF